METTIAINAPDASAASPPFKVSTFYSYYVLSLLWLVALFRLVDLQVIAVLLESIRAEFQFTDTQLGVLTGFSFSLFYATLGLPIAWLADRYSRTNIISIALCLWSLMTALCGMASGFLSLFIARMGVGVGEAGGYPPTTSLVADYFPPEKRGFVFSIIASAIPMGVFVGFIIGGVVNQMYGWRVAFAAVGLPGVLLAILLKLTLREPPRGFSENKIETRPPPAFLDTVKFLWSKKSYRFVVSGACLFTLGAYGSGIWIPSFFIRVHGMGSAEIGIWMAVLYGGGGLIGTLAGGTLGGYLANRDADYSWYMKVCCYSMLAIAPFACFVYLWPNPVQALCVHFVVTVLMHMNVGPVLAMVQGLAGSRRRAMGQAINVLVTNLIALSLGPLIVGSISDTYRPLYGDMALGYGILILVVVAYSLASLSFYFAGKSINKDLSHS